MALGGGTFLTQNKILPGAYINFISVANASAIFSRYPASMGIFVTLTGVGAAVAPTAVGLVADLANIRFGFAVLLIAAVLLVIAAIINAAYFKRRA